MAVPSSGTLTLLGIAQERYYGTYGTGSITGPIVFTDLYRGGNSGGSGMSYPPLNSRSGISTNPPHEIRDWYGYEQNSRPALRSVSLGTGRDSDEACFARMETFYTEDPDRPFNTPLYTDSGGTRTAPSAIYSNGREWSEWDGRERWGPQEICGMGGGGFRP